MDFLVKLFDDIRNQWGDIMVMYIMFLVIGLGVALFLLIQSMVEHWLYEFKWWLKHRNK